ncbi:ATPase component of ABC transporters with duplicated ATPase domain [Clostridium pasteurianum BC1]|uniref:ATPase component of ABC transporters with duplicated ATPase domain n=1 Tax=Clostridium pasteurianum BC1 TaxID=86416 RepID=R4K7K8_CLOPA|nr:ATPase component of ABC transporters with duplicated ATPase domain [Clostridium pasteurianum BC1]
MLIECENIKKYYGERLVLDIKNLKIYSENRVGLVGINGEGKTTLINILLGKDNQYEGRVKRYGNFSIIDQLDKEDYGSINSETAKVFGANTTWNNYLSGGEKTRFKLAKCFCENSDMIIADEPTSNLDIAGIEFLEKKFKEYQGAFIIVSHDREFLDKLCNKIFDLDKGKIKEYKGNYSEYKFEKNQELKRAAFEYEKYDKEKKRIKESIESIKKSEVSIKKTPSRMGNSEGRLHRKMGGQKAKANLNRSIKNMEVRLAHMEIKEKPSDIKKIKLDIPDKNKLYSNVVIFGHNINKSFRNKIIFKNAEFTIYNNSKNALIGPNGCGKSTLIKMIIQGDTSIKKVHGLKIGYYSQQLDIVKGNLSILENVMMDSVYDETYIRIVLGRLLFKDRDVHKKVELLSGGERVKVCFAKLILSDINLLILDEPTNYLDVDSLEVVEEVLKDYCGTILFVSHDRRFISSLGNNIIYIEDNKILTSKGTYEEYLQKKSNCLTDREEEIKEQLFVLENRLSEIIGKLSAPSKRDDVKNLDIEYYKIIKQIKDLKMKLKENLNSR